MDDQQGGRLPDEMQQQALRCWCEPWSKTSGCLWARFAVCSIRVGDVPSSEALPVSFTGVPVFVVMEQESS